jgi:hypothetical protein
VGYDYDGAFECVQGGLEVFSGFDVEVVNSGSSVSCSWAITPSRTLAGQVYLGGQRAETTFD